MMEPSDHAAWWTIVVELFEQTVTLWHANRAVTGAGVIVVVVLILVGRTRSNLFLRSTPPTPAAEQESIWPKQPFDTKQAPELKPKTGNPSIPLPPDRRPLPKPRGPRQVTGQRPLKVHKQADHTRNGGTFNVQPLIFFSSLTGNTERLSRYVASQLEMLSKESNELLLPEVHDLSYIDLDDFFISGPKISTTSLNVKYIYCLLIPSYDIDTILNTLLAHLDETHNDFRIDTAPLSLLLGYSVFGLGDKEGWPTEEAGFCSQAIEVDKWMAKLTGRKRAYPLGLGDIKSNVDASLEEWTSGIKTCIRDFLLNGFLGEGVPGSGNAIESDEEDGEATEAEFPDYGVKKRQKLSSLADLEDVGGSSATSADFPSAPLAIDFTTYSSSTVSPPALKPMVPASSPTYAALTKQGYTIVGTHSGVKICRWTKSALRGRGSCYKNSFYGIKSHLCMETTPSLSCSNKCVFCWRHGTNPVSTTWRWQVDDPELIFRGAKEGHYKKIKMMRGVPGVRAERFEEAMRIRHCALSLVGEPIFYPHINEFVRLLHSERISSFLVCNAQHPAQLRALNRVTQLYVSIDASNRESLKRIDRPLHRDFWERFQACLEILREARTRQRTVFRLTLVKGFNVEDEVEGYADLVEKGLPCFVEVKGVTYCGTSSSAGAGLTMQNVPFYEEVVAFVEALDRALKRRGLQYGIAAEHAHSCCVLLASDRFLIEGKWHTIINYDRFFNLLEAGKEFAPEDYCSPTPEWALWGNGGFDPADERVDRKGKPKVIDRTDAPLKH